MIVQLDWIKNGYLGMVKYLVSLDVDIHAGNNYVVKMFVKFI